PACLEPEGGDQPRLTFVQTVHLGDRVEAARDRLGGAVGEGDLGEQAHGHPPRVVCVCVFICVHVYVHQRREPTCNRSWLNFACSASTGTSAYFFGSIRRFEASNTARSSMYSSISASRDGR